MALPGVFQLLALVCLLVLVILFFGLCGFGVFCCAPASCLAMILSVMGRFGWHVLHYQSWALPFTRRPSVVYCETVPPTCIWPAAAQSQAILSSSNPIFVLLLFPWTLLDAVRASAGPLLLRLLLMRPLRLSGMRTLQVVLYWQWRSRQLRTSRLGRSLHNCMQQPLRSWLLLGQRLGVRFKFGLGLVAGLCGCVLQQLMGPFMIRRS